MDLYLLESQGYKIIINICFVPQRSLVPERSLVPGSLHIAFHVSVFVPRFESNPVPCNYG